MCKGVKYIIIFINNKNLFQVIVNKTMNFIKNKTKKILNNYIFYFNKKIYLFVLILVSLIFLV